MNVKQPIPIPFIVGSVVLALAVIGGLGLKAMSGSSREAPSAPEMYSQVDKIARKSGGDYSKLSADDQKYLEVMSHGHGQKLLASVYARTTASGGK